MVSSGRNHCESKVESDNGYLGGSTFLDLCVITMVNDNHDTIPNSPPIGDQ